MSKYSLLLLDEDSPQEYEGFSKLAINDICQFDHFEEEIEERGQYEEELNSIYLYIEYIANGQQPPRSKFKELKRNKKDKHKDYEFRTKNLRVYVIKDKNGKIIVLGGYKSNQDDDLKKLRRIKKDYFESN